MDDIIATLAWACGEKDCKAQWHKSSYWIYGGKKRPTYSCDSYSDGDHETVSRKDVPSAEEERESWQKYAAYVVETGLDPLDEFSVKHSVKGRQRWRFRINDSIVGPVLAGAQRGRRPVPLADLPQYIRDYLNLGLDARLPRLRDFERWADLVAAQPGIRPSRWWAVEIEHERPRNPATVQRELRALARKARASQRAA
jgi:hypothetical protein